MPGPIRPDEIEKLKGTQIPEFVFEAFNEMIAEKFNQGWAVVTQPEVVERILWKMPNGDRQMKMNEIFNRHWLDIEGLYEEAGWTVKFDSAANGDGTFSPYFTFSRRRRN